MGSETIDEAQLECMKDPFCHMFYHLCGGKHSDTFRHCGGPQEITLSESDCGSVLYTKDGRLNLSILQLHYNTNT